MLDIRRRPSPKLQAWASRDTVVSHVAALRLHIAMAIADTLDVLRPGSRSTEPGGLQPVARGDVRLTRIGFVDARTSLHQHHRPLRPELRSVLTPDDRALQSKTINLQRACSQQADDDSACAKRCANCLCDAGQQTHHNLQLRVISRAGLIVFQPPAHAA